MLETLYGKVVTAIKAYGIDEFDFSRNILGVDFSVREFGYAVFEFGSDCFYISTDGVSSIVPPRKNIYEIPVHESILQTFVGRIFQSAKFDGEKYIIQFEELDPLYGYYVPNDGLTDRSYFELEFPWG